MTTHGAARTGSGRLVRWAGACALVYALGLIGVFAGTDAFVQTAIDPSGQLHISTKHHREIVPQKEKNQTGFSDARISADGRLVGWLALFPSTYSPEPVPLKLVVLVNGEERSFAGSGLRVGRWCFWADGKQVAFEQETLQGGMGSHYELRDIETGELADKFDPDANPENVTKPPRWVVILDSKR